MEQRVFEGLKQHMIDLGSQLNFDDSMLARVSNQLPIDERQIFENGDRVDLLWTVERDKLVRYEATLKKSVEIPAGTVAGIILKDLESRMNFLDWDKEYVNMEEGVSQDEQTARRTPLFAGIMLDLRQLYNDGEKGQELFFRFVLKFLAGTKNKSLVPDLNKMAMAYEHKLTVDMKGFPLRVEEAYNLLSGRGIMRMGMVEGNYQSIWHAINRSKRFVDGRYEIEQVRAGNGFSLFSELSNLNFRGREGFSMSDAIRDFSLGKLVKIPIVVEGRSADRVLYADPWQRRLVIDKQESEKQGLYVDASDEWLYSARALKWQYAMPLIEDKLRTIGLEEGPIAQMKETMLCYGNHWQMSPTKVFGADQVQYDLMVHADRIKGLSVLAVTAHLKKGPAFSDPDLNGVNIPGLVQRMGEVNWYIDFFSPGSAAFHREHLGGDQAGLNKAEEIRLDLIKLMEGPDKQGLNIAAALRLQYLRGTSNDVLQEILDPISRTLERAAMFPPEHGFTLTAMYNLLDGRFVADKNDSLSWYHAVRHEQIEDLYHPKVVPCSFSLNAAIHSFDIFLREVTISPAQIQMLQEGNNVTLMAPGLDLPGGLIVFADPTKYSLMVDLRATFKEGPYRPYFEHFRQPSTEIKAFFEFFRSVMNQSVTKEHTNRGKNLKQSGPEPPTGEKNEGEGQGRGYRR